MNNLQIILSNISVRKAGRDLLNNISLTLNAGSHLAIFGAGGSGKTLLAKVLKGDVFHSGTVEFKKDRQPVKPNIAFVPATHTIKNLSNVTDFYYQQRFNSCDSEDALTLKQELLKNGNEAQIDYWLAKFELSGRSEASVIQLSNGELKKMQLIRYLLTNPQVLVLDRVFTGLDESSRKVLHVVLNELATKGTTIILITGTHELPSCITHFAELGDGKLLNCGPVALLGFLNYREREQFGMHLPDVKMAYHIGPLIQMKGVSVQYGNKQILKNIHWQVLAGECWLVKGANGAGKSTLLSLINADNPQAYSQPLFLFGKKRGSGESIWDIKRKIGFVSPELHNFFDKTITVSQTIASGFFDTMGLYRSLTEKQKQKVEEWVAYFSLNDVVHKQLSSLAPSKQRLVLIARALVKSPLILALDEPCQGLDDSQTRQVIALLDEIHQATGVSIIFISHYDEDVPQCVRNVLELQNGEGVIYKKQQKRNKILQEL